MAEKKSISIVVSGRVQGVGFRYSTCQMARALGVNGWVRNLADGRVEILVTGEGAKVEALVDWARRGPPSADVQEILISPQSYISMDVFTARGNS